MLFLDLFKKENDKARRFIGRYEWALIVRFFLNKELFGDLDRQIAINKDKQERERIVKKLEEIESYAKSENVTTHNHIQYILDCVRKVIEEGQKSCILQNDPEIEYRCFKIFDESVQYLKNFYTQEGVMFKQEIFDKEGELREVMSVAKHADLGGLLTTGEEQQTWFMIACSAFDSPSKKLLKITLASADYSEALKFSEQVKKLSRKIFNDTETYIDFIKQVDDQISEGLLASRDNMGKRVSNI